MGFIKKKKWNFIALAMFVVVLSFNDEELVCVKHPSSFMINGFPLLTQPDGITCGPTSAAMVLNYYGKNVSIDEVKGVCQTHWFPFNDCPVGMTSPDFIKHAFKHYDISAKIVNTDLNHLKYYISENRLPVVLIRSGLSTWHYVVAIGYDKESIMLADPSGDIYYVSNEHFKNAWSFNSDLRGSDFGFDYWGLGFNISDIRGNTLIVPKGE